MGVFQLPPYPVGDGKDEDGELMLRPHYPSICNKKQMPHVNEIAEVTVVVNNSWKVGDLVDMCSHDCYWSGRIKQLLGDDKAKIELKAPPLGEGSEYDGFLKDVRSSLDWSPEHGWTVPIPDGGCPCAQLIKPVKQVGRNIKGPTTDAFVRSTGSLARLSCCLGTSNSAVSTRTTEMPIKQPPISEGVKDEEEKCTSQGRACSTKGKTSRDVESSCSLEHRGNFVGEIFEQGKMDEEEFPLKLDTFDEAVIVLEKYLNKVKWLKKILHSGISTSNAESPKWEFVAPN